MQFSLGKAEGWFADRVGATLQNCILATGTIVRRRENRGAFPGTSLNVCPFDRYCSDSQLILPSDCSGIGKPFAWDMPHENDTRWQRAGRPPSAGNIRDRVNE